MGKQPVITYLGPEPDSSPEMKLYVKYMRMAEYDHMNADELWVYVEKEVRENKDEK